MSPFDSPESEPRPHRPYRLRRAVLDAPRPDLHPCTEPPPGLDPLTLERWRRGCYLKVPFETHQKALQCAIGLALQKGHAGLQPYRCEFCGSETCPVYHLGHRSKRIS